jgi:uncharacterized protein HemY
LLFQYVVAFFGLVFAGLTGILAYYRPGHLVLVYQQNNIEIPLWVALLLNVCLILFIFLIQAVLTSIVRSCRWIGHTLRHWRYDREQKRQRALSEFLQQISTLSQSHTLSVENLQLTWNSAPRAFRYHPEALLLYAASLNKKGLVPLAETVLRQAIDRQWYDSWVRLYGLIPSVNPEAQLKKAEKWKASHATSAVLLLTLGRLSIRNQLWGKAKHYLEQSLAMTPSAEGYAELGRLHEFLGDFTVGESCYKKGILELVGPECVAYPTTHLFSRSTLKAIVDG